MQLKWGFALLVGAALALVAASAVFAAPVTPPRSPGVALAATTPKPLSANVVSLDPTVTSTVTATITSTVTPTSTVVPTTTVVPTSTLSPGNEKIAQAIADYFGVGVDEVIDIHDLAHGWGQVFFVFALAQKSGESPEDIWAMREGGEGWGQIIMDLGFRPGNHGNNVGAAVTGKQNPNATPTVAPSAVSPGSESGPDNTNCKGNPNNQGKGNPCPGPGSNPSAPSNSNGSGNGRGNGNNNGNGKGNGRK